MTEWVDAVKVEDLLPNDYIVVDVDDASVVLFNIDGEFYAIENLCPHDGSEIAGGCVKDGEIECPRHGARFCIKTGAVTAPPAYENIDTFDTRITSDIVQVRDSRWD